jgi:hypothetical protein
MSVSRELAWLTGCAALATVFCYLFPEYGFSPVPFFTIALYIVSGVSRIVLVKISPMFKK